LCLERIEDKLDKYEQSEATAGTYLEASKTTLQHNAAKIKRSEKRGAYSDKEA